MTHMALTRTRTKPTPSERAGSGEPLLLIHPFTMSHHVWRPMIEDLSADHDVLAVTLPGHYGGPSIRTWDVTIDAFADFVEEQMDAAGWTTCHVAGNSLGGWLAFELARRGRARSVTAIAPAGDFEMSSHHPYLLASKFLVLAPLAMLGRLTGDLPLRIPAVRNNVLKLLSADPDAVEMTDVRSSLRASTHCNAYFGVLLAGLRRGGFKEYDEVAAPVRLVLCEKDVIIPPENFGRLYAERLPDVQVTLVPDVGHVPMLEAPTEMSAIVREHVARHSVRGRKRRLRAV